MAPPAAAVGLAFRTGRMIARNWCNHHCTHMDLRPWTKVRRLRYRAETTHSGFDDLGFRPVQRILDHYHLHCSSRSTDCFCHCLLPVVEPAVCRETPTLVHLLWNLFADFLLFDSGEVVLPGLVLPTESFDHCRWIGILLSRWSAVIVGWVELRGDFEQAVQWGQEPSPKDQKGLLFHRMLPSNGLAVVRIGRRTHCHTGHRSLAAEEEEQQAFWDRREAIQAMAVPSPCSRPAEHSRCASSLHCLDRRPPSPLSMPSAESRFWKKTCLTMSKSTRECWAPETRAEHLMWCWR